MHNITGKIQIMRAIRSFLVIVIITVSLSMAGQAPVFEDLIFETDSIGTTYKPAGKNYVFLKSKRGSEGMPKAGKADSILSLPITDIVLVFSELNPDAINNRLEANQERWENLLRTYPQFFQFSTNYKEMCQCKNGGDAEVFKESQGFYIYYTKPEPVKVVEKQPVVTKTEVKEPATKTTSEKTTTEKTKTKEEKEPKELAVEKTKEPKEKKEPVKEEKTVKEKSKKEKEKEKDEENEPAEAGVEGAEQTLAVEMSAPKKRTGYAKPKRSKDVKACRPPCYEGGDESLNTFFKENIVLSKKQKRQVKASVSIVKLQLNFDGSIKKALVNGTNPILNEMVTAAIKNMDLWNPMVKGGLTVKSEVKLTLKYDKATKAIRPFETMITPRPNPKCTECKSDEDIFGKE